MKAQIWDTSGSERYRSITTGHYRQACGALLVFDVTDLDSYESLHYWVNQLRENSSEHIQICLMANKIDLVQEQPNIKHVSEE